MADTALGLQNLGGQLGSADFNPYAQQIGAARGLEQPNGNRRAGERGGGAAVVPPRKLESS